MKTAGIFIVIVILGFAAIYMLTNPKIQSESETNFLTPSPTPNPLDNPTATPSASTQSASPTTAQSQQVEAERAIIKTEKGNITIEFYKEDAPNTVVNFVNKANSGYYNNLTFHRVENWLIQGGDPKGDGTGGKDSLPSEFSQRPFVTGAVGVARRPVNPNISNDSQFFILKADAHSLDGQYTNFGQIVEGMDVVNSIEIGDKILSIEIE